MPNRFPDHHPAHTQLPPGAPRHPLDVLIRDVADLDALHTAQHVRDHLAVLPHERTGYRHGEPERLDILVGEAARAFASRCAVSTVCRARRSAS